MSKLAAVYIRMSTNKQEDSPERQRTTTRLAIAKEGFTFFKEYIDEAKRGWDDNRPAFRQLLADAQAGKFQFIVVDECSRLSRNEPLEFMGDVALPLKRVGVQLYSVAEGGLQDWTKLPGILLSAVYQDRSSGESVKTSQRVTGDYLTFAAQGHIDLGKPPYGYKRVWLDASGKVLHEGMHPPEHVCRLNPVPRLAPGDPFEVEIVRDIFDAYANRDMSLRDIGRELQRRGVPTPAGLGTWSQNCVGRILREQKYTGAYIFNRRHQGKYSRLGVDGIEPSIAKGKKPVQNPKEAWRVIPNFHEPLVSEELFQKVQSLMRENRTRTTPSPNRGDYLLGGLLFCDSCGSPMSGHRDKRNRAFYRCTHAMSTAQSRCHNNLIKESEVLDCILSAVETQLLSPAFLRLCREQAEQMDQQSESGHRLDSLRSELTTLDRDISRARSRLAKVDDETFDFLNAEIAKWTARKQAIEAELATTSQPPHSRRLEEFLSRLESLLRDLRGSIKRKDRHRLRATLREMLQWVKVKVERKLVGKTKHRYFLTGGDIMLRTMAFDPASESRRTRRPTASEDTECVSTEVLAGEEEGVLVGASASLSCGGPRACPR